MNMYIYVSRDRYELPLAVCDSSRELAQFLGLRPETVSSDMSRSRHGKSAYRTRFREVAFEPQGKRFSGQRLQELMEKSSMTRDELACMLQAKRTLVMAWERGKSEPDVGKLLDIADVFGVDADQFFE